MKKTPFFDKISSLGGKMVEFTGYSLPVQFPEGIISEHKAVRERAGLFDVSHMGEILLKGVGAFDTIQNLVTNDITSMVDGGARYALMLNENGGVIDDILIYRHNAQSYMLVVNAANCQKDADWVSSHLRGQTEFQNVSDNTAQLALQGREAINIIEEIFDDEDIPQKNYTFKVTKLFDKDIILSRTGYTGEDGFEIYCDNDIAEKIFDLLLHKGQPFGLQLCGLGARDTLRLEAAMPLYGHEMNEQTLATEIGLNFFIKMQKDNFIGKKALEQKQPQYKRMGIKLIDRGIARENCPVFDGEKQIGLVTSGTHSPTLGYSIAMIRVNKDFEGQQVEVEVRNRKLKAEIVSLPFYKRNY